MSLVGTGRGEKKDVSFPKNKMGDPTWTGDIKWSGNE